MRAPIAANLAGRTVLVTGGNAGIGKEIARALAGIKARVVLACRSPERGEAARRELASATGNPAVELMLVDLGSQASIRAFASAFAETHEALHVLVNNAGIWLQRRQDGPDGIELTWATNVLGYHLLTQLLLPLLRESAPARIVNVASMFAHGLDLSDVEFRRRRYQGPSAYAQSKQANRMLSWALARRLEGTHVTANAMHPGGVNTALFRKAGGLVGPAVSLYAKLTGKTPEDGADTAVYVAASRELEGISGRFWIDRRETACAFRDEPGEEALWKLCESMTQGR
jgi:NAD(P)-dependent dehydrogenase (short-subunit alcohol dehydrogenase family)